MAGFGMEEVALRRVVLGTGKLASSEGKVVSTAPADGLAGPTLRRVQCVLWGLFYASTLQSKAEVHGGG